MRLKKTGLSDSKADVKAKALAAEKVVNQKRIDAAKQLELEAAQAAAASEEVAVAEENNEETEA